VEALWRSKLMKARREYSCAEANRRDAVEVEQQYPNSRPDGAYAVSKAARVEAAARIEYIRILAIFTDLVLRGTLPPPD